MICPKCGGEIKKEFNYCPNCQLLLTKKVKFKTSLKEWLFILLIIGSLVPFIWILISSIQSYNAGVRKEFLCLDACEFTTLYGKEAFFHTLITFSIVLSPMLIGFIILIIISIKKLKHIKNSLKHFFITFLIIIVIIVAVFSISLINTKKLKTNDIPKTVDFDKVTIIYENDEIKESKEKIKYYRYKYARNIFGYSEDINILLNKGTYLIEAYDPDYNIYFDSICIRPNKFQKIDKLTGKTKGFYKINDIKSENMIYKYKNTNSCSDAKLKSLREITNISDNVYSRFYKYEVELKNEGLLFMSVGNYNNKTIKKISIEKTN